MKDVGKREKVKMNKTGKKNFKQVNQSMQAKEQVETCEEGASPIPPLWE